MGDDMSAYRDVFLSESAEYLQAITDGLLALETDPIDLEPVETVFRGAHSLKGMSAAMGYGRTQELTHKMESLMATVRSRAQVADSTLI
ncbi:MAG: Hpt domain-containing protein, partial [Coriobacteriia bacterium]